MDGLFTFGLFGALLLLLTQGTKAAALFTLLSAACVIVHRNRLLPIIQTRFFLFIPPALAMISWFWSEDPQQTLRGSIELWLTVVPAIILSATTSPKGVLLGIFYTFGGYVLFALAFGHQVEMGLDGSAFGGLTDSKNLIADIATTGFLVSCAVFVRSIGDKARLQTAAAVIVGLAELATIVFARSAGAMIGLALSVAAFFVLLLLGKASVHVRAGVVAVSGIVLVALAAFRAAITEYLIDLGTQLFDKDPTLTGRTYLWQRAADLIAEKPFFGKGHHAFWLIGNPDAEGLWQYAGVSQGSGFSFHNTAVEILVHLGWVGLILLATVLVIGMGALVLGFVRRGTFFHCFWLSVIIYETARMPVENLAPEEFTYTTMIIICALGFAFGPVYARMRRPVYTQKRPMPARMHLRTASVSHPPGFRYSDRTDPAPAMAKPEKVST